MCDSNKSVCYNQPGSSQYRIGCPPTVITTSEPETAVQECAVSGRSSKYCRCVTFCNCRKKAFWRHWKPFRPTLPDSQKPDPGAASVRVFRPYHFLIRFVTFRLWRPNWLSASPNSGCRQNHQKRKVQRLPLPPPVRCSKIQF